MRSEFLTDEEYRVYWVRLEGVRRVASRGLGLTGEMKILDVGTGYGYFALEMADQIRKGQIVGIDISADGTSKAGRAVKRAEVADVVSVLKMDATELAFPDDCFDLAASFLGMRDIYMTRGQEGVKRAVEEMIRVVRPKGRIALYVTPPEDMETEDQRIAVEVEGEVFGAVSLPKKFYMNIFGENKIKLIETQAYYTNKRLTADQAKTELTDGIDIARRVYSREVQSLKEVWNRCEKRIEASGYGMYSKVVMLHGEKLG